SSTMARGTVIAHSIGLIGSPLSRERDYRTHRKPTLKPVNDTERAPRTANGPACVPPKKSPPRSSAPGSPVVSLAPARHCSSSVGPTNQVPQSVDRGTHSATHS